MKKNQLLILGISIFSIFLILAVVGLVSNMTNGAGEEERNYLVENPSEIERIDFISQPGFELVKEEEAWTIVGSDEPVNQSFTYETITRLGLWEGEPVNVNARDVGLDFPAMTLRLHHDGETSRLLFGQMNQSQTHFYVKHEGLDQIFLVNRQFVDNFAFVEDAYLDRRLLGNFESISEIVVNQEEERIVLTTDNPFSEEERRANVSGWFITEPFDYAYFTSYTLMGELIEQIPEMSYQSMTDLAPSDEETGLSEAPLSIQFSDGELTTTILIGSTESDTSYYAMVEGRDDVFTLSSDLVRRFQASSDDFHDGFIKIMALDTLSEFELYSNNQTGVLTVEHGDEITFSSEGEPLDNAIVRSRYTEVAGINAVGRAEGDTNEEPAHEITYRINESDVEITVAFVPYDNDHYAAYIDGVNDFIVEREKIDLIMADMMELLID